MEETLLEERGVTITTKRAEIWGTTYPISGVTSVGINRVAPSAAFPLILMVSGVLGFFLTSCISLVALGDTDPSAFEVLLVPVLISGSMWGLAFWLLSRGKPTYSVMIGTSGGDRQALSTPDMLLAEDIKEALEKAIIQRE